MYPIEEIKTNAVLARLARHLVGLQVHIKPPRGDVLETMITGFLFSVEQDWFFMTAGHAIIELGDLAANGHQVLVTALIDGFRSGEKTPLPVDFKMDTWIVNYDKQHPASVDLAAHPIHAFHVRALEASGLSPLPLGRDYLRFPEAGYEALVLVGIPKERIHVRVPNKRLTLALRLIPLRQIEDAAVVPELRGPQPRIHAEAVLEHEDGVAIESLAGTSGGPIFACWKTDDGKHYDYAAIGVQSGWHRPSKQIAAWPLEVIASHFAKAENKDAKPE